MAFTKKYRTLDDAVQASNLMYETAQFNLTVDLRVSEAWLEEFKYDLSEMPYASSEEARREILIYPILRYAWKPYSKYFTVWIDKQITASEELSGIPDYIIAKNSKRGRIYFEQPFIAVIEAKTDNFNEGWGQCVLEMLAIQQLNNDPNLPVFGIVTTGESWQLGKLEKDTFTNYNVTYSIGTINQIVSALASVFEFYKNLFEKTA
jgi:hypothetical protein